MRVTNKIAAMLMAGCMVLSPLGVDISAASNYTIHNRKPSQIYLYPDNSYKDFEDEQAILYNAGNPATKNGNQIDLRVGETGAYQTLATITNIGETCGHIIEKINAQTYTNIHAQVSDSNVIESIDPTVGTWHETGDFNDAGCLQYNFKAKSAGTTTVKLSYEVSYYFEKGVVNCPTCGQRTNIPDGLGFYTYEDTFTVNVSAESETYTITYTDGVEGEIVFPDQGYEGLSEGDKTPAFQGTPVREGYTFMGWAPAVSPTVTKDVTYVATWKRNEPVVDPTEPDDPNAKTTDPTVTKTIDNNVSSVAPGDSLGYTITTNIPDYLGKYLPVKDKNGNVLKEGENNSSFILTVHDDMDDGITVDASSVAVKIRDTVIPESFYTVNLTPECDKHCDFHVSMDLVKLYEGGYINKEDIADAENIIITYSATVNEDITPGSYKNTAWVEFTGSEEPSEPDDPDVDVYGIYLKKVDQDDETKVLSGAEFTLYSEDKTTVLATAVSDVNGIAKFNVSLKAGTYYVKETKAPEGYVASSDFIEVIIQENDSSVQTENKEAFDYYYKGTEVPNVSVPETGGTGTDALYLTGFGIVAAAGLIYFITRRKRTA